MKIVTCVFGALLALALLTGCTAGTSDLNISGRMCYTDPATGAQVCVAPAPTPTPPPIAVAKTLEK